MAQPAALVLGALVAVASLALCCLFAAVAAVLCRHRRSAPRPRVVPPPPVASKPMELSVISAPAPATVRPHRHLRRSAGDEVCQSALLCEETTNMEEAWRRKSDPPRSGKKHAFQAAAFAYKYKCCGVEVIIIVSHLNFNIKMHNYDCRIKK